MVTYGELVNMFILKRLKLKKLHKGDAGPKVKKRLLKNLLQKALYPRCRSKKSPKSPPKSRNNFFEFFLEQEK